MLRSILCLALAACLASCQKEEDKMIIGTWKATVVYYDVNRNGAFDANEKFYPSASETLVYTFKKGGGLDVNDGKQVYPMKWNLKSNGTTLAMILDGETTIAKVLELTQTDLKWETDVDFLARAELKKQ